MIPSNPPDPPAQTPPSGWAWEFAGRSGRGIDRPVFGMAAGADTKTYFDGQHYPASAEQFNGQPHVGNYVNPCGGGHG